MGVGDKIHIPPKVGPDRDAAILDRVRRGNHDPIQFADLDVTAAGHAATFRVFADALKMDGVRVNVSATVEQQIADLLTCVMLTPLLADRVFAAAIDGGTPLMASPQPNDDTTTTAMVQASTRVDTLLAKAGGPSKGNVKPVADVGKHWCLTNALLAHPGRACNYGWHFAPRSDRVWPAAQGDRSELWPAGPVPYSPLLHAVTPGVSVIQDMGFFHDAAHADYSQVCVLFSRWVVVDGKARDFCTFAGDAELAPLFSHEGPLKLTRMPGVKPPPGAPVPTGGLTAAQRAALR